MRKSTVGEIVFSPSDLIRYLSSPFASWMDRYDLEYPGELQPDATSAEQQLILDSGNGHERAVLQGFGEAGIDLARIEGPGFTAAHEATREALAGQRRLIYQGALKHGRFLSMDIQFPALGGHPLSRSCLVSSG